MESATDAPEEKGLRYVRGRLERAAETCGVPPHLREGIIAYALTGRPTGHFLAAFLSNDLKEAIGRADDVTLAGFRPLMQFVYGYLSSECWGDRETVAAWTGHTPTLQQLAAHG